MDYKNFMHIRCDMCNTPHLYAYTSGRICTLAGRFTEECVICKRTFKKHGSNYVWNWRKPERVMVEV